VLSDSERKQVEAANGSAKPTVVFIHGLWLLAGSWQNWRDYFEKQGYATVAADWPDDPASVEAARTHPEVFAGKSIKQVADHLDEVVRAMTRKPALVGTASAA
jgi:non-heme chloroperoxidase